MKTTVTVRHSEIPDALRERASEVVDKLAKLAHRPQRAEVVFDDEHRMRKAELRMYLVGAQVLIASGEADDFRTALDRAADKLRSQLEKTSAKVQERAKGRGVGRVAQP